MENIGLSDFSKWLLTLDQNNTSTSDDIEEEDFENEEVVSESLANILAKQGHTKKSIKMYKKLILIYPEKSSYFAAQINKIKAS